MKPILSVLVFSTLLLGLTACNKPAPAVVTTPAPVVQAAPAPIVVTPSVQGPTTQLEAIGAVKMAPQVKTQPKAKASPKATQATAKHKGVKTSTTSTKKTSPKIVAEKEAYAVAFVNKLVYVCFERLYEALKTGPTPEELASIDADLKGFAFRCIQLQVVNLDDVREFEGKM